MSPDAAEQFLAGRINYERAASMPSSEAAYKLDRMRELLRRLGDPHQRLPIVHIAGTKGKGSTAAMIAAIGTAAGLRVGRFTSPHLNRIEERLAIDGRVCEPETLAGLLEHLRPTIEAMDQQGEQWSPTYFEILTAAALSWFAERRVDWAVLEVGLGGRLDSTNVCRPRLSIVTSISLDHTRQLGETTAAIAAEKAGIIKPGVPVLSGVQDPEPREVIRRVARQNNCWLLELGEDFGFQYRPPRHLERAPAAGFLDFWGRAFGDQTSYQDVPLTLPGRHQAANAALALAAVEMLRRQGAAISASAVHRGLAEMSWPARIEVVGRRPVVVLDAAHNVASVAALVESLDESFSVARRVLVFATTQEKDLRGMLERMVGHFDHIILTRYQENPRGVPPELLQTLVASLAARTDLPKMPTVEIAPTPNDAWSAVHRRARPDDLVCVTGSFVLAGQMRRCIAARPLS
ncbi:MAG: bifunctional folylpolyglutamate synthase/dihydrofolate synthase [Planctomycetaceae bacterium]|nr:bifunctional folylpolyglutamate synthase/dihydrofolate synthase [Planctomycetaceae bacterium]